MQSNKLTLPLKKKDENKKLLKASFIILHIYKQ